jgi:hypothetical protein
MKNSLGVILLPSSLLVLGLYSVGRSQEIPSRKAHHPGSQLAPALRPIATGRQRISRDRRAITIIRGSQSVALDYFTELVIAKITDDQGDPERLSGVTVSLSRQTKDRDKWDIFPGGASDGEALATPENVFRIEKALSSTAKEPVKLQIDGRVYRLEHGEVLLLLG